MKRYVPAIIVIILFVLFIILGSRQWDSEQNTESALEVNTFEKEENPVKDSIDVLIEQRAEQEFNSTIFAGLRFGSKREAAEKVLRGKGYHTSIPIYVPIGERVDSVVIRDYDAEYYKEQLASLVLYANEDNLYDALGSLYAAKYGLTKENCWTFLNCEVFIERRERNRRPRTTYDNDKLLYYDSFRGQKTEKMTDDARFIAISYKSTTLLNQKAAEENEALEKEIQQQEKERIRKQEQERELARKLSTEVPTNI